jgi:hypothetical protein
MVEAMVETWITKFRERLEEEKRKKRIKDLFMKNYLIEPSIVDFNKFGEAYAYTFVPYETEVTGKKILGIEFYVGEKNYENCEPPTDWTFINVYSTCMFTKKEEGAFFSVKIVWAEEE